MGQEMARGSWALSHPGAALSAVTALASSAEELELVSAATHELLAPSLAFGAICVILWLF